MSPLEILAKKISQPVSFRQPANTSQPRSMPASPAEAHLVSIQREIHAIPEGESVSSPRRDIAAPLRWFIVSDMVALAFGFVCAWAVAMLVNQVVLSRPAIEYPQPDLMRIGQYLFVGAGLLLWFEHTGHYRLRMPFWIETQAIVASFGFAMVVDGFMQFAAKQDLSRLWLVLGWGVGAMVAMALRFVTRRIMADLGLWRIRTLLIGGGKLAEDARAALSSEEDLGYDIVAQIENLPTLMRAHGNSWDALCRRLGADYVIFAMEGNELADEKTAVLQLTRESIPFSIVPPLQHMPVSGMVPHYFMSHNVMFMVCRSGLEQPLPRVMKRIIDICAAAAAVIILSPVMLVLALLVKKDGGPIFYADKRIGMNGRVFNCLKFRSMVMGSDTVLHRYLDENPQLKTEWDAYRKLRGKDPRVTAAGRFMRKTSLDELPQLFNVLIGDMSIVGPRPIMVVESEVYNRDIVYYYRVRPGITGLWQVSGRNNVTFAKRIEMDAWYVRNWSLWHDIAIMCRTIPVLLFKTGAY